MAYTTAEARAQILDELAAAADRIGIALSALSDAYEWVDESTADRLEQELFHSVQAAYGRAQRTHGEFARRHGLAGRSFSQPSAGTRPGDARAAIERAGEELREADELLASLQDSMLPVEVGDQELRAGLTQVRDLISGLPHRAHDLLRTLGR